MIVTSVLKFVDMRNKRPNSPQLLNLRLPNSQKMIKGLGKAGVERCIYIGIVVIMLNLYGYFCQL